MSYIGRQNLGGAYRQLDDISSGFDGSDTTHTMQVNSQNVTVGDVNQIILSLGGVIQKPGTDFTVSGSTLTFTTAPASGLSFFAILLGSDNGGTVTPTDGSVTSSKLAYPFVVNEDGADNDFRVESNSNANALHVDGGNSSVGINTTGPSDASLQINDTVSIIKLLDTDDNTFSRMYHSGGNFLIDVDKGDTGSGSYFQLGVDDEQVMKISADGEMTLAKQPAFSVRNNATQSNISNATLILFGNEIYDVGSNFASDHTFTAPVTGKYQFNAMVRMDNLDSSGSWVAMTLQTSNRNYGVLNSASTLDTDSGYWTFNLNVLADMDANDTANILFNKSGGSDTGDATDGAGHFNGYLVC